VPHAFAPGTHEQVGGWTRFAITDAGNGKYFLTAPEGPMPFQGSSFAGGQVGMGQSSENGPSFQVTITEAGSQEAEPEESEPEE